MIDASGRPIRGSIDPFKPVLDPILNKVCTENGFEIFREYLKDAIALRMQHTLYNPISITDDCINIINKHFNDTYTFAFIQCSLKYYENHKKHKINHLNTSCPSCSSKDAHKSLQHARQDCLKCVQHYIKNIKIRLKNIENTRILKKYSDIEFSARFTCEYIYALLEGNLPKEIKSEIYDTIIQKDNSISTIYKYNAAGGYYTIVKKRPYLSVSLETATEIFCSCYTH